MSGPHYWVIKSENKIGRNIWGKPQHSFFADRTAIKNPRYAVEGCRHYQVKWFSTKKQAEEYYFKKSRYGFDVSKFKVTRKKLYVDKKGDYDYFRNRESFIK